MSQELPEGWVRTIRRLRDAGWQLRRSTHNQGAGAFTILRAVKDDVAIYYTVHDATPDNGVIRVFDQGSACPATGVLKLDDSLLSSVQHAVDILADLDLVPYDWHSVVPFLDWDRVLA